MSTAAAQGLPIERLQAWLAAHVEGFRGPVTAERFAGGQSNPTYKLTANSVLYVLRKKPPGPLLPLSEPHFFCSFLIWSRTLSNRFRSWSMCFRMSLAL